MEEILASIRKIIADEQPASSGAKLAEAKPTAGAPAATRAATAAPAPIDDDILDLDEPPPAELHTPDDDVVFMEEPPAFTAPAIRTPPPDLPRGPDIKLLSQHTDAAVGNAFQSLAGTIIAGSQRTLDDIVKELMRPLLKHWLDDNLPGIVERLVRAEIERVARGGR